MIKKIIFSVLMLGILAVILPSCGSDSSNQYNITFDSKVADMFDLEQFSKVVLEENPSSAKEFADIANREDINNIDLDGDPQRKVEEVKVETSTDGDQRTMQLYCEIPGTNPLETQEIAKIIVTKTADNKADMDVVGNEQVYGAGHVHHCHGLDLGDYLLLRWMFGPMYPPYGGFYGGWGYGPGMYGGRTVVSTTTYRERINTRNINFRSNNPSRTSPSFQKTSAPVHATKSTAIKNRTAATGIKAQLNNPTASQRSFKANTDAARSRAGGFNSSRNSGGNTGNTGRKSGGFSGGRSGGSRGGGGGGK